MIDDTRRSKWSSVWRQDYLQPGCETLLLLTGMGIFWSSIPVTEPEGERIMSDFIHTATVFGVVCEGKKKLNEG